MSNNKERKIPDYLKFPFERYILVRVEFLILTQNELEAKIMRIIEWAIESKRDELSRKGLEVPDEVWVTIPENIFMDWLYGTVQSETTLKAAIKSLKTKYLIFKRPSGTGRYDALEYTLNKPLISKLFTLFPEKINDVDMASIMKQPRKSKDESEGQKLTPSKIDPLIRSIREAIIDPLNRQLLTPSGAKIDPLTELGRGAKIDPKKERKETEKESKKESDHSSTHSLTSLSDEDLLAELNRRERERLETATSGNQRNTDELDPSRLVGMLSPEENRIHSYWQELGFEDDITPKLKEHWGKLVKSVQTFEQFKSLYDHTKRSLKGAKDETVYPGNMAKCLTAWKQTRMPEPEPEKPKNKAKQKITKEYLDTVGYW